MIDMNKNKGKTINVRLNKDDNEKLEELIKVRFNIVFGYTISEFIRSRIRQEYRDMKDLQKKEMK